MGDIIAIRKRAAELDSVIEANRIAGKTKWNEYFETETELISCLKQLPVVDEKSIYMHTFCPAYRGYVYIHSFVKNLKSGKPLTSNQIKQAKRLAPEI